MLRGPRRQARQAGGVVTLIGLALIVVGVPAGAFADTYNGQWLLGVLLAFAGLVLVWLDRKGGPRDH